jgi:hypothetical protein
MDPNNKNGKQAFEEAMQDMEVDKELTATNPNDDLDEEESARLGENDLLTTDGEPGSAG